MSSIKRKYDGLDIAEMSAMISVNDLMRYVYRLAYEKPTPNERDRLLSVIDTCAEDLKCLVYRTAYKGKIYRDLYEELKAKELDN